MTSARISHVPAGNVLQGYGRRHFIVADRFNSDGVPAGAYEILVDVPSNELIVLENQLAEGSPVFDAGMSYAKKLLHEHRTKKQ